MSSALFGNGHHYSTRLASDGTPLLDLDGVDEDSDRAVMMQRKVRVELQAQDRRYTEVVYADNLNANGNSTHNASTIAPRPAPSTSFLAPTAAPPAGTIAWTVASGTCTIDPTSNCAMSPNYPAQYGNNERCEITVTNPGPVNKEAFQTERGWDKLNVNGRNYHGNNAGFADSGEEVRSMSWRSDGSVTSNGWKFCPSGGTQPSTQAPTQPPSCPADTCSPTDYTSCWNSRCASCAHCLAPTNVPAAGDHVYDPTNMGGTNVPAAGAGPMEANNHGMTPGNTGA